MYSIITKNPFAFILSKEILFYLIFTDYISCKYFEFYNVLKMNSN